MRDLRQSVTNVTDFVTPAGSCLREIREGYWDGQALKLRVVGSENIQDRIQAYAPFCDLHYMLHRLSLGDSSVLTKTQPVYADFSGMPDNPVDAINLVNNARAKFDQLDIDQRKAYNMDYMAWLADKLSGKPVTTNVDKEIDTDESKR